ncbi:alginate lyase family protein [Aeribacillus sp. FSL K6-1305]|uniref:alginate lyase family protein n=1 Tax=Aeribacillus sp. FSL K6-1305 TaxID=2954569 RepID=UPI0030FDBAFC
MGELTRKIQNLRKLPIDKALKKIVIKLYEILYYKIRKEIIKLKPIDIDDKYFINFKPNCNFFFSTTDKQLLIEKIKQLNIEMQIINDADKICSHIFNLLGSGDIYLGEQLPWNTDFKTNFVWENKFYKDIKIIDLSNNADVKVPWELSRFQHLFTLGKAYWLTNDEKYAIEFKEEIEDWIEKNPVEMSVNWTCTMDVAIRAVNWIAAYFFFKDSPSIDKNFWTQFHKSLYLHGRFIIKNLENKGPHTGNHYLSNIVGLVWLGLYFGSFIVNDRNKSNNPKKWLDYGLSELEKEMFVQNNPDGTNYEASTSYHRLVTELFLKTTVLCNKNNIRFSKDYMDRLEKMCEFIMNITKPNGLAPIIGDADDGRLLILSIYSTWVRNDFRHLLGIAGELFDRDDFRYYGKDYIEDALWIYQNYKSNVEKPKPLTSVAYRDGGYYILRNDRVYCCIRCGELSFRGEGVHSHNDQLSFELNIDGEDLIIDPGSYVYTADYKMRNLFRSTAMHNTVQVEEFEQNDFEETNLFYMKERTYSQCEEFTNMRFSGFHKGFIDDLGLEHHRTVNISEDRINIYDKLVHINTNKNKLSRTIYVNFIINPSINIYRLEKGILLKKNNIYVELHINNSKETLISDVTISPSYGVSLKGKKIQCKTNELQINTSLIIKSYGENNESK